MPLTPKQRARLRTVLKAQKEDPRMFTPSVRYRLSTLSLLLFFAVLGALLFASIARGQDVTPLPDPEDTSGIVARIVAKVSPGVDFLASGALASALITGVLLWLRAGFKAQLAPDPATETSRLRNLAIAFAFGLLFGLLGIAPAIPLVGVHLLVQKILGGFFAATVAVFGRDFIVRGRGMFEERKEAKAALAEDPRPPLLPNGFARLRALVVLLVLSLGLAAVAATATYPFGTTTRLTLAAATPTLCPTAQTAGRDFVLICNNDTAAIYQGFGTASASTGPLSNTSAGRHQIDAGDCWVVSVGLSNGATTTQYVWCYSVAGTAANAVELSEQAAGVR